MSPKRSRFVLLADVVERLHAGDPRSLIREGRVIVDGAIALNVAALVRTDASVRIRPAPGLRGTAKLRAALVELNRVRLDGSVALDLGASAGGFTRALLEAGATRVYAVDAGVGQLVGSLRNDPRVVNLERTNLSALDDSTVPDALDLATMDLSYLAAADAIPQLGRLRWRPDAELLVLVKPTFELRTGTLAAGPAEVTAAVAKVRAAAVEHRWRVLGATTPRVSGAGGAVEVFVHLRRWVDVRR